MLKTGILTAVIIVVVGVLLFAVYFSKVANPRVIEELRSQPDGERAKKVALMTFPNGRTLPLNYLREDAFVYFGADFPWWRELDVEGTPVTLLIQGEQLHGVGRAVLDDPQWRQRVFARLRVNVPKWLPDWLDAKLVVVTLDSKNSQKSSAATQGSH